MWIRTDLPQGDSRWGDLASAIAASWDDHHDEICALIHSDAGYDNLILYDYAAGGPDAGSVQFVALTTGQGTGTEAPGSNALCAVYTLQTALAGRSHRGRMYLPANALGVVDGTFDTTAAEVATNNLVAWFNGINGIAEDTPRVVVMSEKLSALTDVISVKCTNKPGTQRRREKSTLATHRTTVPLA